MRTQKGFIALLLIILTPFLYAQSSIKADSLKQLLFQTSAKEPQFDLAVKIAEDYLSQGTEKDSLSYYLNLVLTLGKQLPTKEETAKTYLALAGQCHEIKAFERAANLASVSLNLTDDPDIKFAAQLLRNTSLYPYEWSSECFVLLDSVEIYLNQISNPDLLAKYYAQKGTCYINNSRTLEGLNYLLKAEELKQAEDCELVILLTNIAAVYDELEIFDKTMELGLKAQEISQRAENKCAEIVSTHAIISGAFALKKYDLVKENCQKALDWAEQRERLEQSKNYLYYLLGKTAIAESQYDLAIEYFQKSLTISTKFDYQEGISYAHEGLSEVYFQKNDWIKAKQYVNLALEFTPPYISDRTFGFAQVYEKNKDYKTAYQLLKNDALKKAKRDSINNRSLIISTLLTENIEQEKARFEQELIFQRQLGIRNLTIALSTVGLMFVTFWFFYNRRKNKYQKQELEQQVKQQTHQILEQKERLQELDLAKSRLYTNITHEFRTPLTVISGIASQLEGKEEQKELIKRNSDQLLNLVNQMLDLRKLESGAIQIHKKQGDIIKFLRYLTESLKSYASSKNLNIHFIVDEDSWIMDFDAEKITRIHSNLLSNAIKFTPKGGNIYVQITVSSNSSSNHQFANASFLTLTIRDTGIGIASDKLPYIFERFYQVDSNADSYQYQETTRKGEGTGIGLTLVSELLKAMQGNIEVKSKEGKGATFTIQLPITNIAELADEKDWNADAIVELSSTALTIPSDLQEFAEENKLLDRPTILIVEDNVDVIHFLISCLKNTYNIEIAMDGEEGIEKALEDIPDLIVSDVMMPNKDGFELCQTLKTEERSSHIPIILLTAKADIEARLEGLQKGADAYLNKPFHQEELLIILDNQLNLRRKLQTKFAQLTPIQQPDILDDSIETKIDVALENAFLQKIRDLLEKDLSDSQIGMPQLIRGLGMSRSQIYKKVKALTGLSPSRYIRIIRLYHAKQLLENGELNVSEIAYEVGFSSPVYFSDVFFEEFGIRPNETRKKL